MKLKEIKPGMVIHLKNQEEYALLMDELERLGYVWYASVRKPTVENYYPCEVIHTYSDNGFLNITYSMTKGEVAKEITHEFSDLIIEEEMSAYETMQILGKICNEHECIGCPIGKISPGIKCQVLVSQHSDKVFEICRQWKSDHEKIHSSVLQRESILS